MQLVHAVGNCLASASPVLESLADEDVERPVLQLCRYPIALNPELYANPLSHSNPRGTLTSLHAFRALVDPVPSFTKDYVPGPRSTETVYGNLVHGANAYGDEGTFTASVLASARQRFDTSSFSSLDGSPSPWRPVYATPGDWYDVSRSSRFMEMSLDPSCDDRAAHPYIVLGAGNDACTWKIGEDAENATSVPLDRATTLQTIRLRLLQVDLTRPWLDFQVFHLDDWYLQGQEPGYYSTGTTEGNRGVLPLLPTSMIVGLDTAVLAEWSKADREVLTEAVRNHQYLSLGPFALQLGEATLRAAAAAVVAPPRTLYVVGWLSRLVPLSPVVGPP